MVETNFEPMKGRSELTKRLAARVDTLSPSTTLAITAKAKEMKESGIDVIGLGAGEPDYNTPENILEAAYASMKEGKTKYTPSGGLPALKDAVIRKLENDQGLQYSSKEIMIGIGAKHVLYTLFQVILDPGDEVIIPTPYWVSYPEQVKLAGGVPVHIEGSSSAQFKVTATQIQDAVTAKTKAVIINSPGNPTGMVYSKEELEQIAAVCRKKIFGSCLTKSMKSYCTAEKSMCRLHSFRRMRNNGRLSLTAFLNPIR